MTDGTPEHSSPTPYESSVELEHLVTSYYEALGFRVTPNANIGGHQIDHVGSKYVSGAGHVTVIIETKYRGGGSVGIDDVTKFKNTVRDLRSSGLINIGTMVTNTQYSQDAQAAAIDTPWLNLFTLNDLEQDLFNYSDSLLKIKSEYELSDIFQHYIPLFAAPDTPSPASSASSDRRRPPITALDQEGVMATLLAKAQGPDRLAILIGDFGSGKTTVVERLFYELARERLKNTRAPYPVLLRLRGLLQYSDLWSFISDNLRDNQYISPTRRHFESKLSSGDLFLLLDGFDEIKTGATAADRAYFVKQIAPLLSSPSSCILATRPTYFKTLDEMMSTIIAASHDDGPTPRIAKEKVNFDAVLSKMGMQRDRTPSRAALSNIVELQPLSPASITRYLEGYDTELRKVTGFSAKQICALLLTVYDIRDLMKRPLILNMIVVTLLEGGIKPDELGNYVGPSDLYEIYTTLAVRRDLKTNKDGLTAPERLAACRELALKMLWSNKIELSREEVRDVLQGMKIRSLVRRKNVSALEEAVGDIAVRGFMSFAGDGCLRFSHKSFFEFFVAQAIVLRRESSYSGLEQFIDAPLNAEIMYFLGSFARGAENFRRVILSSLESPNSSSVPTGILCRRIAMASGDILDGARLRGGPIHDTHLTGATVTELSMRDVNCTAVTFDNVTGRSWEFLEVSFSHCRLSNLHLSTSVFHITADDSLIESTNLDECSVRMTGPGWRMVDALIQRSEVSLNGDAFLSEVKVSRCDRVELADRLKIRSGSDVTFERSTVIAAMEHVWYSPRATMNFKDCKLVGVFIDPAALARVLSMSLYTPEGASEIKIYGCSGIIFTDVQEAIFSNADVRELEARLPGLHILDRRNLEDALRLEMDLLAGKLEKELSLGRLRSHDLEARRLAGVETVRRSRTAALQTILNAKLALDKSAIAVTAQGLLRRVAASRSDPKIFARGLS